MAEKANILVAYEEDWFEANWVSMSIWCAVNMKKGCTLERTFARFQIQDDADKFKECGKIT